MQILPLAPPRTLPLGFVARRRPPLRKRVAVAAIVILLGTLSLFIGFTVTVGLIYLRFAFAF